MSQLSKMFTIVSPDDDDGDEHCELLFCKNTGGPFTEEDMYSIVRDPTCTKIMGGNGILAPIEGGKGELLLFTNDMDTHAINQMDNTTPDKILMLCSPLQRHRNGQLQYYVLQLQTTTQNNSRMCGMP